MNRATLGIQVNDSTIRLLMVMGQWEQARVTLSTELDWGDVWRAVEALCSSTLLAPSVVLFSAGIPSSCGMSCSPRCADEECTEHHTDCTAADRDFGELRERLLRVTSCP
jgi:hypothetical protein